ncbi:PREDICTED: TANK-binding kinase 1-binding protein 1 [Aptenodytes forsteri]|uniref:TANK-binding kinase 1-binding protein 1 n=1 Tax=Aptenodytes forsteri TaxID=9233 RepID=UPI0004F478AB|nr:PREDICTED: TANK-binding kinase 1-binding protein 1 [Aptenodytes forsteri]
MDSMFEDDISILTQEALGPDEDWLDSPNTDLSGEMCSASHFALITAYDDIKNRLTGLERENSTLKRRLKMYEVKYPLIGEFGEEHIFSLYEAKETSLLKSEKASLQQQLNQFQHELQKSKEREEQLEEMIQAYEKLCVEKADLETELGEMVGAGGGVGPPPPPPSPGGGAIRCASFCAGFPIPDADAAHRTAAAYARAEHAQSWPSINLLLETVDSEVRSCPLCQLAFPIGYPDDALVKHIDSHLENSKI